MTMRLNLIYFGLFLVYQAQQSETQTETRLCKVSQFISYIEEVTHSQNIILMTENKLCVNIMNRSQSGMKY